MSFLFHTTRGHSLMNSYFIKYMKLQIHLFYINGQSVVSNSCLDRRKDLSLLCFHHDFILRIRDTRGRIHNTFLLSIKFFLNDNFFLFSNLRKKIRIFYIPKNVNIWEFFKNCTSELLNIYLNFFLKKIFVNPTPEHLFFCHFQLMCNIYNLIMSVNCLPASCKASEVITRRISKWCSQTLETLEELEPLEEQKLKSVHEKCLSKRHVWKTGLRKCMTECVTECV